jgi:CRISPR/Cas system-associated exonuclease Cas4 (RecB family)
VAKKHRQYDNDFPSVTQTLDCLRKKGLEFWFQKNTLEFITQASEKGKLIGTQIHDAIESHIEKGEAKIETQYAIEVTNALKSFMLFKKEHPEINLKKSEMMLTSLIHGYNGTMDVEGEIAGLVVPGDWKSGEAKEEDKPKIYPEHIYQVSAYLKAFNEVKEQKAREAFIAVFAKDKVAYNYQLFTEEEINEAFEEVFLSALKIKKFQMRKGIR